MVSRVLKAECIGIATHHIEEGAQLLKLITLAGRLRNRPLVQRVGRLTVGNALTC